MKLIISTLILMMLFGNEAKADYHKCITSDGKIIFTDSPPLDAKCEYNERNNSDSESTKYVKQIQDEADSQIKENEEKRTKIAEERNKAEEEQKRIKEAEEADKILSQYQTFKFDGFEWEIIKVKKFSYLGSESSPQKPSNGVFIVVEIQLKNISKEAKYYGSMTLLSNGTQYPQSSMEVYAKYQLGYESNSSTKFEPGSTLKTYAVFDAKSSYKAILLIEGRIGNNDRIKVNLSI